MPETHRGKARPQEVGRESYRKGGEGDVVLHPSMQQGSNSWYLRLEKREVVCGPSIISVPAGVQLWKVWLGSQGSLQHHSFASQLGIEAPHEMTVTTVYLTTL